MKLKCLSSELLKLIAGIAMLIDHFAARLYHNNMKLRAIGRIAFPIYCFLMAEGLMRTRNKVKYLLRLGLVLLLSELPFDLYFFGGFTWAHQSVMFTLGLGCLMGCVMEMMPRPWLKPFVLIPFYFAGEVCNGDYGGAGVAMVAVFLLSRDLPWKLLIQTVGVFLLCLVIDSAKVNVFGFRVSVQLFAVFAMIPIAMYSGKKLTSSKAVQWAFYFWYPAHIVLLMVVKWLLR